jgi:hypothetical protein
MNRIRDVNFGEDKYRSLNHGLQKTIRGLLGKNIVDMLN